MLDIKFIRENLNKVKKAANDKKINVDLDKLILLDDERKKLLAEVEMLRKKRNELPKDKSAIDEAKKIKRLLKDLEPKLNEVSEEILEISLHVPNIPSEDSPVGGEEKNKVVRKVGEPGKKDFKVLDHIELGRRLDIIDTDRGVKTSGFRGYYLKNEGAILHMALMQYAFSKMAQKDYIPMIVPTLVKKHALVGSGQFPHGQAETYKVANAKRLSGEKVAEETYLVGTAEPSLLSYYSDEIINADKFPVKFCGFSQCYRSEAGSYGKDTKGLYRLHEFAKVEQVIFCEADEKKSEELFNELLSNSEEILKDLELPYQVVQIATGDMGAGKYKMFDIETWMPERNAYCETHSNSHLTDWQSRRLNIRYKNKDGKNVYPYAMNNTAIASPRILIALLGNHQQKDGSVKIPKVLHKYTGFIEIKAK